MVTTMPLTISGMYRRSETVSFRESRAPTSMTPLTARALPR